MLGAAKITLSRQRKNLRTTQHEEAEARGTAHLFGRPIYLRGRVGTAFASSALAVMAFLLTAASGAAMVRSQDEIPPRLPLQTATYEVEPGDTLLAIAQQFGVSADTLRWANDLGRDDLLRIGQKLTILPFSGVLHKTTRGETLSSIAELYSVQASRVQEANELTDADLLQEGQLLMIPGGIKLAPKPVSAPTHSATGAAPTSQYTVKPGDTLRSIASSLGVPFSALLAANSLPNPDVLKPGQRLGIPGGREPANAAASQPAQPQEEAGPRAEEQRDRSADSRGGEREGKSFIATITTYSLTGRTATGTPTRWGIVAVDPRVIPLGTRLMVEGFEEVFVAEDTGGGVKGAWVDIWFPNHADAVRFGLQSRRVTIIEP